MDQLRDLGAGAKHKRCVSIRLGQSQSIRRLAIDNRSRLFSRAPILEEAVLVPELQPVQFGQAMFGVERQDHRKV